MLITTQNRQEKIADGCSMVFWVQSDMSLWLILQSIKRLALLSPESRNVRPWFLRITTCAPSVIFLGNCYCHLNRVDFGFDNCFCRMNRVDCVFGNCYCHLNRIVFCGSLQ